MLPRTTGMVLGERKVVLHNSGVFPARRWRTCALTRARGRRMAIGMRQIRKSKGNPPPLPPPKPFQLPAQSRGSDHGAGSNRLHSDGLRKRSGAVKRSLSSRRGNPRATHTHTKPSPQQKAPPHSCGRAIQAYSAFRAAHLRRLHKGEANP